MLGRINPLLRPLFPIFRPIHSSSLLRAKSLRPFLLADIGEGITECEILKWSVKPSSTVSMFDPLCEVQSDKASVEITSPFDGLVKEILVKEGEIAKVGQGLCIIEVEDNAEIPLGSNTDDSAQISARLEPSSTAQNPPSEPPLLKQMVEHPRRPHPLDPSHPRPPSTQLTTPNEASSARFAPAKQTLAAPSVRYFARQNNIDDLSVVLPGSGKGGRIEKKDVEAYLSGRSGAEPKTGFSLTEARPEEIELGRTRWAMYKAMTKSLEIPHFGYSTILDLTALSAFLPTMNAHVPHLFNPPLPSTHPPAVSPNSLFTTPPPPPISDPSRQYTHLTFLPLLLKTLSRAMLEWPIFRTSILPGADAASKPSLALRPHADISLALSTPTGLYSPTIQSVDAMSTYEIMGEIRRLQNLGRQVPSGLTGKEMPKQGGTVTVSNVGAIGKGEWASPLLVPGGGVAIVAIGRAKWVAGGSDSGVSERRLEVGVSWSADHRIVEGAEMAAFMESWRAWVEHPERLIADGR